MWCDRQKQVRRKRGEGGLHFEERTNLIRKKMIFGLHRHNNSSQPRYNENDEKSG